MLHVFMTHYRNISYSEYSSGQHQFRVSMTMKSIGLHVSSGFSTLKKALEFRNQIIIGNELENIHNIYDIPDED